MLTEIFDFYFTSSLLNFSTFKTLSEQYLEVNF